MENTRFTGILGRRRLQFRDNEELEKYYEEKYRQGGYEGGCIRFGINISELYHRERHRSALRFLAPAPGDTILDAGCGDGRLAAEIAAGCRLVHAIDIAGNAFDSRHQGRSNLHFSRMNVESLRFDDGLFDRAVAVETLEHVLDPHRALAELHRVLRPGGRLVLTYPTINRTLAQRALRALRLGAPLEISEHLTEWSYHELLRHAGAAGFEVVAAEGLVFDLGPLAALKSASRSLASGLTALSLRIRAFPRNSLFVTAAFRRR